MADLMGRTQHEQEQEPTSLTMEATAVDTPHLQVVAAPGATFPTQGHAGDAGWDLYVQHDTTVPAHGFADIPSGVRAKLPAGTWGMLTGRSSTLRKRGLLVVQGVIDEGYTGELFSAVWNLTSTPVVVAAGERVAQLIVVPRFPVQLVPVTDLVATTRGSKGFGSTGL